MNVDDYLKSHGWIQHERNAWHHPELLGLAWFETEAAWSFQLQQDSKRLVQIEGENARLTANLATAEAANERLQQELSAATTRGTNFRDALINCQDTNSALRARVEALEGALQSLSIKCGQLLLIVDACNPDDPASGKGFYQAIEALREPSNTARALLAATPAAGKGDDGQ